MALVRGTYNRPVSLAIGTLVPSVHIAENIRNCWRYQSTSGGSRCYAVRYFANV